jgi:hypothetical protein
MKQLKKTWILMAAAALAAMVIAAAPAQARTGSNTGLGSDLPIDTVPRAQGTRWMGTLTLSFEPEAGGETVTTYIFLRLDRHTRLEAYAGKVEGVAYPLGIQGAVSSFVSETVIPGLYGCTAGTCPTWALKSVEQYIEDMCDGDPSCLLFMMMDVVIAVKD